MDIREVESAVQEALEKRKKRVLNRNAFSALFGAVADPVGSLGKIFVGRQDALDAEESRIKQDVVLNLLCRIDEAISGAKEQAAERGVDWTIISGRIEARGERAEEVTGVDLASDAGPVEFKPGTHISSTGSDVRTVTGLKVGGKKGND